MPFLPMVSPAVCSVSRRSKSSILLAAEPASGCSINAVTSAASQPGSASVSLLSSTSTSPCAAATPALQAAMKPLFCASAATRTQGNSAARYSTVPSLDASSTTITSKRSAG